MKPQVTFLASFQLILLFNLLPRSSEGQLTFAFEYEEPNLALESQLNEFVPEGYNYFIYDADSLYQNLQNTGDSIQITLEIDSEFSFDLVLNNRLFFSELEENSCDVFSKVGYVSDLSNSSVYAHFSTNYF